MAYYSPISPVVKEFLHILPGLVKICSDVRRDLPEPPVKALFIDYQCREPLEDMEQS